MARRSRLAAARRAAGHSQESLARNLKVDRTTPARWESGASTPYPRHLPALAEALKVDPAELDYLLVEDTEPGDGHWTTVAPPAIDDIDAIELIRRAEASDVGPSTLTAIDTGADLLCRAYTSTPPAELLVPLQAYRSYAVRLLDGRATLTQRRQLTVTAGWLSLLAAICHVDLHQYRAAALNLEAAASMATEADDSQLAGWVLETRAWQALTDGNHTEALQLCRAGRDLVGYGTSAHVQLSVQEARAAARLGLADDTHRLLDLAAGSLDQMPISEHPEHHFQFDPRKLVGYRATTLAWLGDDHTAAEDAARQAVAQYDLDTSDGRWKRRLATARVDLALVLASSDQPDEATHLAHLAIDSGRVVPSNLWRLAELDHKLGRYSDSPPVNELHDRYIDFHRQLVGTPPPKALGH